MASLSKMLLLPPLIGNILSASEPLVGVGSESQVTRLFSDDLNRLRNKLSDVEQRLHLPPMLVDSQVCFQVGDHDLYHQQVHPDLQGLLAALDDACDLLDYLSSEVLSRTLEDSPRIATMRRFFSRRNKFIFPLLMSAKIAKLLGRLDSHLLSFLNIRPAPVVSWADSHVDARHCIAVDEDANKIVIIDFVLRGGGSEPSTLHIHLPQHFPLDQKRFGFASSVIGREYDEKEIVSLLLLANHSAETTDSPKTVVITGIPGVGKTSLANAVFWNEQVKLHFRRRLWVRVDGVIVPRQAIDLILSVAGTIDWTASRSEIEAPSCGCLGDTGRYLLVLDGLSIRDSREWQDFQKQLQGTSSSNGSRILVTTREAFAFPTASVHYLKGLSGFHSCQLLCKEESSTPYPKEAQNQVIYRCAGIPLALETARFSLSGSPRKDHRRPAQCNYLDVFEQLRQSFDALDPHLKHCFAICSIFPMDSVIDKWTLIKLWMAVGLIEHVEDVEDEEVGDGMFFQHPFAKYFCDQVEKDEFDKFRGVKLHRLMCDFLRLIANTSQYYVHFDDSRDQFSSLLAKKRFKGCRMLLLSSRSTVDDSIVDVINEEHAEDLSSLRALGLRKTNLMVFPSFIDRLMHLSFLDLSENPSLELLPSSITKLCNLQTLKLSFCVKLKMLPRDIGKLPKLRHLENNGCWELTHMPRGIRQLTSLQTLSMFTVADIAGVSPTGKERRSGGGELSELEKMDQLKGGLELRHLERATGASNGTKAATLKEKKFLEMLTLSWERRENESSSRNDETTLEDLQPYSYLKGLCIDGYRGERFPSWLSSSRDAIPDLVKITLINCSAFQQLPPLHQLQHLKCLMLEKLDCLKFATVNSTEANNIFPALTRLCLKNLPVFKGWFSQNDAGQEWTQPLLGTLPKLIEVTIDDCPVLESLPLLPKLECLTVNKIQKEQLDRLWKLLFPFVFESKVEEGAVESSSCSSRVSQLKSVGISCIWDLDSLSGLHLDNFDSLEDLEIRQCPILTSLPCFSTLRSLSIFACQRITSISEWTDHLLALEKLSLKWCPELDLSNNRNDSMGELDLRLWPEFDLPPTSNVEDHSPGKSNVGSLWSSLRSLISLEIVGIPKLLCLPKGLQLVTTLQHLELTSCESLSELPVWIDKLHSLRRLSLNFCPMLKPLPEELHGLKDLYELKIIGCPLLEETSREYRS